MAAKYSNDPTRFNDALKKMSNTALDYQCGRIKHVAYVDTMDAILDASGWAREEFHAEIERRKNTLRR